MYRKIKGPSWIDIKMAAPSNPQTSWCKVEAVCQVIEIPVCSKSYFLRLQ